MTRILCNLPLECFEAKQHYRDLEILSYGPTSRTVVDGIHYPPDVVFDPSQGTIEELLAALPPGFSPDLILIYWPDQAPLPKGLERCPIPVVGVMSDYNLSLPYISGLWPFFDSLLCDRSGVDVFTGLSFSQVRYFCQFSFKAPYHRVVPGTVRDLDISFAGNFNPIVQAERMPWLQRVHKLEDQGVRTEVKSGIFGPAYGAMLNRSRLGFNRSIRGEMNLRAFEVPACGALLLMERENLEIRDFLTPGEEVILYGDDDLEDQVLSILADEPKRTAMARAGHERIQDYRMSRRIPELLETVSPLGIVRSPETTFECRLSRAVAMLVSSAKTEVIEEELTALQREQPDNPRLLNALGLLSVRGEEGKPNSAIRFFQRAMASSPSYLPATANLAYLLTSASHEAGPSIRSELEHRLTLGNEWSDLDGPILPLGYSMEGIMLANQTAVAIRQQDDKPLRAAFSACLPSAETQPCAAGSSI